MLRVIYFRRLNLIAEFAVFFITQADQWVAGGICQPGVNFSFLAVAHLFNFDRVEGSGFDFDFFFPNYSEAEGFRFRFFKNGLPEP